MVRVERRKSGAGKKAPSRERGKKTVQGVCGVRDDGKRTRKKNRERETVLRVLRERDEVQ